MITLAKRPVPLPPRAVANVKPFGAWSEDDLARMMPKGRPDAPVVIEPPRAPAKSAGRMSPRALVEAVEDAVGRKPGGVAVRDVSEVTGIDETRVRRALRSLFVAGVIDRDVRTHPTGGKVSIWTKPRGKGATYQRRMIAAMDAGQDYTSSQLANALGTYPSTIRKAGRCLLDRGLVIMREGVTNGGTGHIWRKVPRQ